MNLDAPLETIVSYLPEPPEGLHYSGAIDTYQGIPGIYVSISHQEYSLFGSFIPFADVYFLRHSPNPEEDSDKTYTYYEFVDNGVLEVPMSYSEITAQVKATITELANTFQAFFNIFVPLTEVPHGSD